MLALRSQRPLNIAHAHGVDMQQRRGARQLRDEDESYIDAPGKAVSAEGRSAPHYGRAISCPLPPRPLQVEGFVTTDHTRCPPAHRSCLYSGN